MEQLFHRIVLVLHGENILGKAEPRHELPAQHLDPIAVCLERVLLCVSAREAAPSTIAAKH